MIMGYLSGHTTSNNGNPKVRDNVGKHELTLRGFKAQTTEKAGNILVATFTDAMGNFMDEPFFIDGTGWAAKYQRGALRQFVMALVGADPDATDAQLEGTIDDLLGSTNPGAGIRINAVTRATSRTNKDTGQIYNEVDWHHVGQDDEQIAKARAAAPATSPTPAPPTPKPSLLNRR